MPEHTDDRTYWTLRKHGEWYLVVRLRSGTYEEVERYGWYEKPGAAATAVGVLAYRHGVADSQRAIGDALGAKLGELGLAVPAPDTSGDTEPLNASLDG